MYSSNLKFTDENEKDGILFQWYQTDIKNKLLLQDLLIIAQIITQTKGYNYGKTRITHTCLEAFIKKNIDKLFDIFLNNGYTKYILKK